MASLQNKSGTQSIRKASEESGLRLPPIEQRGQRGSEDFEDGGKSQSKDGKLRESKLITSSQSAHQLYISRQLRKRAEEEEQALLNRLRKLKQEDQLLEKRIEETENKVHKIYEIKKRAQGKRLDQQRKKIEVEEVPFTQPRGQLMSMKIQLAREEAFKTRKMAALEMKRSLAEYQNLRSKQEFILSENQKWEAQKKRQVQREAQEKIREKRNEKIENVLRTKETLRVEEEGVYNVKQEHIKKLEQDEMELLSKLKKTQIKNQQVDEQLEFIINNQPKKYEERYLVGGSGASFSEQDEDAALDGRKYNSSQQNLSLSMTKDNRRQVSIVQ